MSAPEDHLFEYELTLTCSISREMLESDRSLDFVFRRVSGD